MMLTTASSRFALPALRGWPLFIALSLLFHLLLFLLLYLFVPERLSLTSSTIAPISVQIEATPQQATVTPATPAPPAPPVTKKAPEAVTPKPIAKPLPTEPAQPAQIAPPPIPDRYRNLGTGQRVLDTFPDAGAPAAPPQEEPNQDNDKHLEIESQIRTRFAEHFVYPRMAQIHGWQGEVVLSFRINVDGSVSHIHVVHGSGHAILDQAAIDSMNEIKHIEFTPGTMLHNVIELRMPVIYHLAQG